MTPSSTECIANQLNFGTIKGRKVIADFTLRENYQVMQELCCWQIRIKNSQRGWICWGSPSIRGGGTFNNTIKCFKPKR